MKQLKNYADDRLINGCIYCGRPANSRDHVPSRCLLESPFPENLPVVAACTDCNQGFSQDEEYLCCLVESVLCGSVDPDEIKRPSVAKIMKRSTALRRRIGAARKNADGRIEFSIESDRVTNVMLKLARGHAAFELSQPCRESPDAFWCGPLLSLDDETRDAFNSPHMQQLLGEVGSRGLQRMMVARVKLESTTGTQKEVDLYLNDWMYVQDDLYRYLAIEDCGGIVIRIILSEYLACEVAWHLD